MASNDIDLAIRGAISSEIARAKLLPDLQLQALGQAGTSTHVLVGDHTYEISLWSQPAAEKPPGEIAVLVEAWRNLPLGLSKRHLQGFFVLANGTRLDIPESELWRYD